MLVQYRCSTAKVILTVMGSFRMPKLYYRLRARSMAWLFTSVFVALNGAFAESEVAEESYRRLFQDFLQVAESSAEKMDMVALSKVTDEFQRKHQRSKPGEIFVWHRDVQSKNHLLFSKKYFGKTMKYPKVHYADERKVNVFVQKEYVLVDYRPRESKVSYRLVFLR